MPLLNKSLRHDFDADHVFKGMPVHSSMYLNPCFTQATPEGMFIHLDAPMITEGELKDFLPGSERSFLKVRRIGPYLTYKDFEIDLNLCDYPFFIKSHKSVHGREFCIFLPWPKGQETSSLAGKDLADLRAEMRELLKNEEYLKAIPIRDEINRRTGQKT